MNNVENPSHYNQTPVETIEMFYLLLHDRPDMTIVALLFNVLKYRELFSKKNGKEYLDKMNWYVNQLELHYGEEFEVFLRYHGLKGDSV